MSKKITKDNENLTSISLLDDVMEKKPKAIDEFRERYADFLRRKLFCGVVGNGNFSDNPEQQKKEIKRSKIYTGCGPKVLRYPDAAECEREQIVFSLQKVIDAVLQKFLSKKLDEEFVAQIKERQAGQKQGKKVSVRTTLQYMLVNYLRSQEFLDACPNVIVNFTEDHAIELREAKGELKDPRREMAGLLRNFRICLTRLCTKDGTGTHPSGFECYCLKYGCTDKNKYIDQYIQDEKEKIRLKEAKLNDEDLSIIFRARYSVAVSRRTIGKRLNAYCEKLMEVFRYFAWESNLTDHELKTILTSRAEIDSELEDTLLDAFKELCIASGAERSTHLRPWTDIR